MRHPLTLAEAKVWARVRNQQLGFKIRRQHPIGRFIADFCCAPRPCRRYTTPPAERSVRVWALFCIGV
jgi:hypothetical protein